MKKAVIIVVVLLVALGSGLALSLTMWQQETESGLLLEEVVPPDALYWVEIRDAGDMYSQVKGSKSWSDLQASPLLAQMKKRPDVVDALDTLATISDEVGYELDETNVMKFIGDELGAAVYIDEEAEVHVLVVSRIDTEALTRDLLSGEADWRDLQAELDNRVAKAGCDVTVAAVGEYKLATAKKDETEFHVTLMQDLLVVSNSEQLARDAIALRVAGGEGSLGRNADFRSDMDGVPEDAAATDWMNLDKIRKDRKRIARTGDNDAKEQEEVATLMDDVMAGFSVPSVARTLRMPDGDIYELTWEYSKSAEELFVDNLSPDLRDIVPQDVMTYVEVTSLTRVQNAWDGSNVRAALADSWFATKLEEAFDAPEEALSLMDLEHLASIEAEGMSPADALADEFTRTVFWSMMKRSLSATFGGGFAAGFSMSEEGQPVFVAGVRLDIDGRVMESTIRNVPYATTDTELSGSEHEGRRIAGVDEAGSSFYWTTVGDMLVVSNDLDMLHGAMDRAVAGEGGGIGDALDELGLSDDSEMFLSAYVDMPQVTNMLDRMGPEFEMFTGDMGYGVYGDMGFQLSVPDDFGHVKMTAHARLNEVDGPSALDPYRNAPATRPTTLDAFPEATFLYAGASLDYAGITNVAKGMLELQGEEDAWSQADEAVEEICGITLTEIMSSFGPETAFGAVLSTEPISEQVPAIPGMVMALGVRDPDKVKQALDGFVEWYKAEMEPPAGEPGPPRLVRAVLDGREIYRVESSDIPLVPAMGLIDGMFYVTSDLDLLTDIIAVRGGGAPSIAQSSTQARILATGVAMDAHGVGRMDWGVTMDQVAVYAPMIAEFFTSFDSVPFPDYPEDGNEDEWNRRMTAYHEERVEAAKGKEADVLAAIDSMRFIDYMVSSTTIEQNVSRGVLIVGFK